MHDSPLTLEEESFEEQSVEVGDGRDVEILTVSVPLQPAKHIML